MLYLDYSRSEGEWIPNEYGGRENLNAISFLRRLNEDAYGELPDTQTIAEESTAWPGVSRPTYAGGLGFGLKWDMGWMHDTLRYFSHDPIHRRFHQNELTFRGIYAFTENFMLPLSHDEVVHGKGSLLGKMPGDDWQKFANLRLLLAYQWMTPGKKLLFMGGEIGQWSEWNHESSLDWNLLDYDSHRGIANTVEDLNRLYRGWPALHERDTDPAGFEWIDANDVEASVLSFLRIGSDPGQTVLCVFNLTPIPRQSYRVGVPQKGFWRELFNSDAPRYGGTGQGNLGGVESVPVPHARPAAVDQPDAAAARLRAARTRGHLGRAWGGRGWEQSRSRAAPAGSACGRRGPSAWRSCSTRAPESSRCSGARPATTAGFWTGSGRVTATATGSTGATTSRTRPRASSRTGCTGRRRWSMPRRSRGPITPGSGCRGATSSCTSCTSARSARRGRSRGSLANWPNWSSWG